MCSNVLIKGRPSQTSGNFCKKISTAPCGVISVPTCSVYPRPCVHTAARRLSPGRNSVHPAVWTELLDGFCCLLDASQPQPHGAQGQPCANQPLPQTDTQEPHHFPAITFTLRFPQLIIAMKLKHLSHLKYTKCLYRSINLLEARSSCKSLCAQGQVYGRHSTTTAKSSRNPLSLHVFRGVPRTNP